MSAHLVSKVTKGRNATWCATGCNKVVTRTFCPATNSLATTLLQPRLLW